MQLGLGGSIFFAQDLEVLQLLDTFREMYEINLLFRLGDIYIYIYTQGVPGGMCQTSGECFLS